MTNALMKTRIPGLGSCFKIIFLNIYFTLFCYFLWVRHLVTGCFNKNKNITSALKVKRKQNFCWRGIRTRTQFSCLDFFLSSCHYSAAVFRGMRTDEWKGRVMPSNLPISEVSTHLITRVASAEYKKHTGCYAR